MALNPQKIFSIVMRALKEINKVRANSTSKRPASNRGGSRPQGTAGSRSRAYSMADAPAGAGYPGDYRGKIHYEYNPSKDGNADPGEIVWTWVPYEEDYSQGKDRPVLIVGRDSGWLLGLMLTSKDRNNSDHRDRNYMDIGTGDWDRERRPSEVKLDRIIRVGEQAVRREGAILDRERFSNVVNALNERA
ncbi:MAG: type II toxin-antitoxin system PemK/MazF family toxin [Glutamicibacter sp.]